VTGTAAVLLGVALLVAVVDWVAVARSIAPLEYVCKPAAALAFLATALALDPSSSGSRTWCCVALGFCVIGDVFLMLPRDAFLPGLAAFAVAQTCFAVSFTLQDPTPLRFVVAIALVVPGAVILARRFVSAATRGDDGSGDGPMVPALLLYITVISAMVVSALAGGTVVGIAGALLFLTSDSLIAEHRFVAPRRWQAVAIIVTYHLALAGLVLGQL
jgi:alkenylglycerophosphocholine/alkenylglycerophosphoethanolamine hydrolase